MAPGLFPPRVVLPFAVTVRKAKRRLGMTKADLIEVVYARHGGLTKDEAAEVVETILHAVKRSLLHGKRVRIKNFGTFEIVTRPGRVGINPASGEKIFIPEHRGLSFRPARRLKEELGPRSRAKES